MSRPPVPPVKGGVEMWYRRKSVWAVLGAALAVVVVIAGIVLLRGTGPPRPAGLRPSWSASPIGVALHRGTG